MAVSDTDLATAEGLRETIKRALTETPVRDTLYYPGGQANDVIDVPNDHLMFYLPPGIYETVEVLCERYDGGSIAVDVIELEPTNGSSETIGGRTLTLTINNRVATLTYTNYQYGTEGIVGVFGTRAGGGLTF